MTSTPDPLQGYQLPSSLRFPGTIAFRLPFLVVSGLLVTLVAAVLVSLIVGRSQVNNLVQESLESIAAIQAEQLGQQLNEQVAILQNLAGYEGVWAGIRQANTVYDNAPGGSAAVLEQLEQEWALAQAANFAPTALPPLLRQRLQLDLSDELIDALLARPTEQNIILAVDQNGAVVGFNFPPTQINMSHTPWWQALQSGESHYLFGPTIDMDSPATRVMAVAVPVYDPESGALIGALYEGYDYAAITATLSRGQFSGSGRTALIAANGDVIYASIRIDDFIQANVPIPTTPDTLTTYTGQFGRTYLYVTAPVTADNEAINELGWYAAAVQLRAEALAAVSRTVAPSFGLAAVVALGLIALLYMRFIRPLTGDLHKLQAGAVALQQGQQQDVSLNRLDELGLLAATFNTMAFRLRTQLETQESIIANRTAELQRRAAQLQAAVQIGQAASASLELEKLLAETASLIQKQFGFYHVAIYLLEPTGQFVSLRAATGQAALPSKAAVGSASLVGWVAANRRARVAAAESDTVVGQRGLRAEAALPLIGRGDLLGVLDVHHQAQNIPSDAAFSAVDLAVLQLIADQIAAAVLNARAFRQSEIQAQQLQYVLALGQQLNRLHDVTEIVWRACRHIQETFGYDAVHIAELQDIGWSIQAAVAAASHLAAPLGLVRPLRSGLPGQAMQQGKPLLVSSRSSQDAGYYDLEFPVAGGEAAAPLLAGSERYGAIGVYTEKAGILTPNDLNLLALCAETIGAAIANARLLARVERNLAELNRLYQQTTGLPSLAIAPAALPGGDQPAAANQFTTPLVSRGQIIGELVVPGSDSTLNPQDQNLVAAIASQIALTVENSRLFGQTQARLRETEALYQLTSLLSTSLDVDEIYQRAARAFTQQLNIDRCLLAAWDQAADAITIQADSPLAADHRNGQRLPAYTIFSLHDFPTARQALHQLQTINWSPAAESPAAEQALLRRLEQSHMLLSPLAFAGEAVGLILLFRSQGPFTAAETRLVSAMANQTGIALHNALLATEARSRVAQLTTLYRVGQRMAQAPTLDAVFDGVRREILTLTEATELTVYLAAPDAPLAFSPAYHYQYGVGTNQLASLAPDPFSHQISQIAARSNTPLILNAGSYAEWQRRLPQEIPSMPGSAWACFPLVAANNCIGVLTLAHRENVAAFPPDDANLLETISTSLAVAINNQLQLAQTKEALQTQTAQRIQLETAAQVAAAASSILDVQTLMQSAVELIEEAFALYYVGIFLVDAQSGQAVLRGATGEAGQRQLAVGHHLPLGPGSLIGSSISDGQVRLASNVQQDPEWRANPFLPLTRAELAMPLRVRERATPGWRIIGALTVQSERSEHFTPQLVQTLQTMANQIAIAIDNARLLQESILYSTQLQLAAEVSRAASTILDRAELIATVVNLIQEQFDLYYVGLFLVEEGMAVLRGGTGAAGKQHLRNGLRFLIAADPPVEQGSMVGVAIARGTALVEQDVRQAKYWAADPLLPATRSELTLPLRTRGRAPLTGHAAERRRVIGAISAQSDRLAGFAAESIAVLQSLADQVAIAIENTELFAQIEQNLQTSTNLYETGRQITEAADANTIYHSLMRFTSASGLCDMAMVIAPDPLSPDHLLTPVLWSRLDTPFDPTVRYLRDRFPHSEAILGQQVIILRDGQTDERLDSAIQRVFQRNQVHSAALIPIQVEQEWLATLVLTRVAADPLPTRDLQPFLTLADQAATLLANQRLLAETDALYRISGELNQALTQEDALDITVRSVANYTAAPQCRFVLYDRQAGLGYVVAEFTRDQPQGPHLQMPITEESVFTDLARRRELIVLEDSDTEAASTVIQQHVRQFDIHGAVLIPAFSQKQLVGYLALDFYSSPHRLNRSGYNYAQAVVGQLTTFLENIRLLDDTLRSAQELVALNQIGTHISGILDVSQLAEVVDAQLGRLVQNDTFALALYTPNTNRLQTVLCVYDGETMEIEPRHLIADEPLYRFLHAGVPLIAAAHMPLVKAESSYWGQPPLPSSMWAPLLREDDPIGFITVQAHKPDAYPPNHLQLLRTVATQTSLAVTNAQLFQQTQQNVAELRKLFRISQAAASSIEADVRIRNTVSALQESLNQASVAIYILDETERQLVQIAARGSQPFAPTLSPDHGLARQALTWGEPIIVNDVRTLSGVGSPDGGLPGSGLQNSLAFSQLIVPLALGRRVIGIISVQSQQLNAFSEDDLRLLQTLSSNLAATIESARLFQEIQAANERLREVDRLKTQFLANMSHELRTPLNSIIGFSRLMLKGIDGPITTEQEEDLTSIHHSGQHLLRLINDILDMSKIEAGKMVLLFEQVDLAEAARNVLATITALLSDKPVTLLTAFDPELPLIEADPIRIRQILLNLLSNAAKFTDAGTIRLQIQREDDFVHLQVADTGKGIEEKHFDKLFREFEQVDASPTREVGGTGLGLPITRNLVALHGGEIWVESELGRGATFHVRLPIRQAQTGAKGEEQTIQEADSEH